MGKRAGAFPKARDEKDCGRHEVVDVELEKGGGWARPNVPLSSRQTGFILLDRRK